MTRTLQTASTLGGSSNKATEPGEYHMAILEAADGTSQNGKPIDGCSMVLSVLAGPEGQVEKQHSLILWDPDMSKDESKQERSKQKQTSYAIAGNQCDPSKLGEEVELDFGQKMIGQQVLIKLGYKRKQNEKGDWVDDKSSLDLSYDNIYHVDDPRAAKFPKDEEALGLLPKEYRKPAEYFAPLQKKKAPKAAPKLDTSDL